jgi:ATP-dependent Lon protease
MEENNWDPFNEDEFAEAMNRRTEELYSVQDLLPNDQGLINGPVLAMRDMVIFPHMVSPLFVGREPTLWAIEKTQSENRTLIALTQRDPSNDTPGPDDFFPIGVEMAVGRLLNMPDGSYSALVQARRRVELIEFTQTAPYLQVSVRPVYESVRVDREIEATMRTAIELFNRCIQLNRSLPEEAHLYALNIEEPGWLADMIATSISPNLKERLQLLAMVDPQKRLDHVVSLLAKELDVLELEDEIQSRTQSEVDRTQREFYLREQMKVIQTALVSRGLGYQKKPSCAP